MASFWAELQERQEGSARERKHGSRPQDWPLDHGTAFSVAAEKALGRRAAGPGRCLGATARGCARRRRAAPAAPRLCLGARSRRSVGSCGEPRAEARVPLTVGVTRVSGRLSRLPSFRRVFPLSGPYARALPLRPAFDAQRGRVPPDPGGPPMSPGAPSECGPRGRENSQRRVQAGGEERGGGGVGGTEPERARERGGESSSTRQVPECRAGDAPWERRVSFRAAPAAGRLWAPGGA